ncbi:ATP synthase F1 subunit delta [Acholeplasma vituli]|uniref:ATP synthase subunit delta n=1 Tax=Paracholeplasma vituli TaxID=69473 RepID=A0ABT2PU58_9MOLU|nr:ATP synthase F1 subunit delta [Paracholeplasma vituli]MCU0104471.1 ATP synthase F1 subunit delta [Paracholeplasma vituli]
MTSLGYQYAEALYALSVESQKQIAMKLELERFIGLYKEEVKLLLTHPKVAIQDKKRVIQGLKLDTLMTNFLFVLIDNHRLDEVTNIQAAYQDLLDRQNQILRAKVYSNKPLSKTELEGIKVALQTKLNRQTLLENVIDSNIVGGIKIAYEGNIVDHTINHFIASLSETLKA